MRVRHGLAAIFLMGTLVVATGVPASAEESISTDDTANTSVPDTATDEEPAPRVEDAATEAVAPAADYVTAQDIAVESIQIAVSNTGDNRSEPPSSTAGATAAAGTGVTTGAATAIGSSDSTGIRQQVVTDVDATSRIEVLQVSIVFNIGGALANSGNNVAAANRPGGAVGTIGTGDATAIGNDAATFVTQGARAVADEGEAATVDQRTATLHIGLAMANSGGNVIVSNAGSGGAAAASSGSASAIGNLSSTAITQRVGATGRDGAGIAVEQRATVINFGLAFADSGTNRIGAEFAAAFSASDQDALERLLAVIVPALVASLGQTSASGEISTGDARAVGNRSSTEVLQVAVADATSGSVRISQDVVVVNAGAATATTGANAIGATGGSDLTAGANALAVAGELTNFLRSFLADIEAWSAGTSAGSGSAAMTTQLGDFDIGIDRTVATQTAGAGSSIITRQLAAVVNLAIARANSGGNHAVTGPDDTVPAAALTPLAAAAAVTEGGLIAVTAGDQVIILTGDASARNTVILVLCQRANMTDLECLAPRPDPPLDGPTIDDRTTGVDPAAGVVPPPDVEQVRRPGAAAVPALTSSAPTVGARSLPATGGDPRPLVIVALAMLLVGSAMIGLTRRTA